MSIVWQLPHIRGDWMYGLNFGVIPVAVCMA